VYFQYAQMAHSWSGTETGLVSVLCRYDSKCDVWSIGCILWDMANSAEKFVNVSCAPGDQPEHSKAL